MAKPTKALAIKFAIRLNHRAGLQTLSKNLETLQYHKKMVRIILRGNTGWSISILYSFVFHREHIKHMLVLLFKLNISARCL